MVWRERDGNDIKISSVSTNSYLCYSTKILKIHEGHRIIDDVEGS